MDIHELESLAIWYTDKCEELIDKFQQLINPVQYNASQNDKQPLEGAMNALSTYLRQMNFEVLSYQQIEILKKIGVYQFIGHDGANFVENTIKTADFDPATGYLSLKEALNRVKSTRENFDGYIEALDLLDLGNVGIEGENTLVTIRIGFQNGAAIDNITKWKDYSKEWYDIIRGISLATNNSPEETQVIGAATGSIILILASVAAVTEILARISKHVASVAKASLEIQHSREDLRQKKFLTKVMETEFADIIEAKKKNAFQAILEEIKPLLPDESGDKIPALTNSIKKLLEFNEKGGNVDFVTPDVESSDHSSTVDVAQIKAIAAVREAIHEYQQVREELKLLSYQSSEER